MATVVSMMAVVAVFGTFHFFEQPGEGLSKVVAFKVWVQATDEEGSL